MFNNILTEEFRNRDDLSFHNSPVLLRIKKINKNVIYVVNNNNILLESTLKNNTEKKRLELVQILSLLLEMSWNLSNYYQIPTNFTKIYIEGFEVNSIDDLVTWIYQNNTRLENFNKLRSLSFFFESKPIESKISNGTYEVCIDNCIAELSPIYELNSSKY